MNKEGGLEVGSHFFPNPILCNSNHTQQKVENNYMNVLQADFMLFALSPEVASKLANGTMSSSNIHTATATATTTTSQSQYSYKVDVDIIEVSANPNKKLWNWITYTNEERLRGYDYVWFIDGDIQLTSLNWQAFFHQVRIMQPNISQPASIGASKE